MGAKFFNGSFCDLTKLLRCTPLIIVTLPMRSTYPVTTAPLFRGASSCRKTVNQGFQLASKLSERD